MAQRRSSRSRSGFLWVDLDSPSQSEFNRTATYLGLKSLTFDQLIEHRARHAIDQLDNVLVITFKALQRDSTTETKLTANQVTLCVTDNVILTVHNGASALITEVRRQLNGRGGKRRTHPCAVLHAVCDEVVAEYDRIAHDIETDIIDLEHKVFDQDAEPSTKAETTPVDDIYALKREVLFFRRVEDPLHPVIADLARGRMDIRKETCGHFRQTLHQLDRVDNTIDSLNELITSILQAHLAQVAVQQNEDMRRISSWAALVAVPTMIAGIYGMNFRFMPELNSVAGYPLALTAMVIACLFVFRQLKKSGWL